MLKLNTPLNAPCCELQFLFILINQKMCHIHSVKQQSNLYVLTNNTFFNIPYLSAYKHISRTSLFNIATLQLTLSIQTLDSLCYSLTTYQLILLPIVTSGKGVKNQDKMRARSGTPLS
jgi:hypothetical protein